MRDLTDRQRKFVDNIVSGMSQRQAYLDAYPSSRKWRPDIVDSHASALRNSGMVSVRIKELQDQRTNESLMTYEFKRKKLQEIVEDEETSTSDKMKAMDLDNKMEGLYVNKVEVSKPIGESVKELEAYIDERRKSTGGADL